MTKILLEKGARVNDLDGEGRSTLYSASYIENETMITLLIDNGAAPHIGENPLLTTVENRYPKDEDNRRKMARLLIAAGVDINKPSEKDGQTVLMRSIKTGDADMVRFYLEEAFAKVLGIKDDQGRTAEILAKRGENKEIIELIENAKK